MCNFDFVKLSDYVDPVIFLVFWQLCLFLLGWFGQGRHGIGRGLSQF